MIGGFGRSVRDVALLGAVLTGDRRLFEWGEHGAPRIGLFQTPAWPQADVDTQNVWSLATQALATHTDACQDVVMPQNFGDLIDRRQGQEF